MAFAWRRRVRPLPAGAGSSYTLAGPNPKKIVRRSARPPAEGGRMPQHARKIGALGLRAESRIEALQCSKKPRNAQALASAADVPLEKAGNIE